MHTGVTSWRKSTRSGGAGNDNNCVEIRRAWRKSTRSGTGGNDNNCVEVSLCSEDDGFHLRDSKLSTDSPVFDLSPQDFSALVKATALSPSHPQATQAKTAGRFAARPFIVHSVKRAASASRSGKPRGSDRRGQIAARARCRCTSTAPPPTTP
jgi:hypothetical protein